MLGASERLKIRECLNGQVLFIINCLILFKQALHGMLVVFQTFLQDTVLWIRIQRFLNADPDSDMHPDPALHNCGMTFKLCI